jgi:hypothetical protein
MREDFSALARRVGERPIRGIHLQRRHTVSDERDKFGEGTDVERTDEADDEDFEGHSFGTGDEPDSFGTGDEPGSVGTGDEPSNFGGGDEPGLVGTGD